MVLNAPAIEDLSHIAQMLKLELSPDDLETFRRLLEPRMASYARLDELAEPSLPVKYPPQRGPSLCSRGQPSRRLGVALRDQGALPKGRLKAKRSPSRTTFASLASR
jgi:hypothetical protein